MSDEELTRLLSEIQEGAKELNSASDEINSIISSIEQKIVFANVGLECWLEDEPLREGVPRQVSLGEQKDQGYASTDTILGYAKTSEGWKLCVKDRLYVGEVRQWGDDEDPAINHNFTDPQPLWRASRLIRIEAMKKMPALLKVIHKAIDDALGAIATGRKLAR